MKLVTLLDVLKYISHRKSHKKRSDETQTLRADCSN